MTETPEAQPKGTPENPLTREDVLRCIEKNGGTARGLDLSGRVFEEGIDLSELDLAGIIMAHATLREAKLQKVAFWGLTDDRIDRDPITCDLHGADLRKADLQGAYLGGANLQGAQLREANLQGAFLDCADLPGANLFKADCQDANMSEADLQGAGLLQANLQGAILSNANLQGAKLRNADLQGADLEDANLQGADLEGAKLSDAFLHGTYISTPQLEFADWSGGHYVGEEKKRRFADAMNVYHLLRTRYTQLGMGGIASEFFYREKTAQRKACWAGHYGRIGLGELVRSRHWRGAVLRALWPRRPLAKGHHDLNDQMAEIARWVALRALWPQRPLPWLGSWLLNCLFGYGERPWRVVGWWGGTIAVSSLAYFAWGGLSFWDALYYSLVSFPALGYGGWVKEEIIQGWVRWAGPIEALWGVILMALFLTTFVRKMTR